ncbi:ML domain-containing protein [Mrakia frigida]|uniref:ML domain-containing protein n=1 Tax=Mrakia frigida TaxID=29902 RepID=UPI003FCC217E
MLFPSPTLFLLLVSPLLASALPQAEKRSSGGAQTTLSSSASSLFSPGGSWSSEDCGEEGDAVILESIDISPDPPIPGQNLTVTVKGVVVSPITDGSYADVLVKFGLIKLIQRRFDLCELASENNATVQCPVLPGPLTITETVELPKEIPPGKYNVQIRAFTAEDDDMLCENLRVDFPIRRGASVN